jgi:hypothetical protein
MAAITVAAAMMLAFAGPAAAKPWQKAWGDYDNAQQWHDANWWLKNQPQWVISHHPEWKDNYAATPGQIGDSDRLHARHYGDGGLDRSRNEAAREARKSEAPKTRAASSMKTEALVKDARES